MQKPAPLLERLRRHRLLWNLLLIAAIILTLALAAHLTMLVGTRHGARRAVPDFSGMPLAEAKRAAARRDLRLKINDSLFVAAYAGGIVLDQLPEGGVEVKPGRTVYLTINSFRQKMVEVPYVAERSLRQAKNMLEIAGLEIGRIEYRPDLATNYVLEARANGVLVAPDSRIEAEAGSGIDLVVGVAAGEGTTVVPLVVGATLLEAKSRLWESGLNVGRILFDEGIDLLSQKTARVYIQHPGAEQGAPLGTDIALRLTLDTEKSTAARDAAERDARLAAEERLRARQAADSLAAEGLLPEAAPEAAEGDLDAPFFE